MARLNQRPTMGPLASRTPITTTGEQVATGEGGVGFARDAKAELFLSAVSDFTEKTFYEGVGPRQDRQRALLAQVAVSDPEWVLGFVGWLRGTANMRTVSITVAASAVKARLDAGKTGFNRAIVAAACLRADEPGEFLAHWLATYGRNVPMPVKRGLADAASKHFTESAWLKWRGKGEKGAVAMADVLNLAHPKPRAEWQGVLFKAILDHSKGRKAETTGLPVVSAREYFLGLSRDEQVLLLSGAHGDSTVKDAALTHQVVAGALGKVPGEVWPALVPSMGYQALLMNLRRMKEDGAPDWLIDGVNRRLSDEAEVARSRMLPMRMLAAYRNAPIDFHSALERAAKHSLANVPALPGRTLILVDCSGSMSWMTSERGTLNRMDSAALFGAALALRAEDPTLVRFGTTSQQVTFRKSESVLRLADAISGDMGGTNTATAVLSHYHGHDRVIILTDEQAAYSGRNGVFASVPEKVHCFTWNLDGNRAAHAEAGRYRHAFGGLNDAAFDLIRRVETGFATWPWETADSIVAEAPTRAARVTPISDEALRDLDSL